MDRKLRRAYASQKFSARRRGIPFLLTKEEWLLVWVYSGRLSERGRGRGKYCMARNGDVGPYAVWNVRVVLDECNRSEQAHPSGWNHSAAAKRAMSKKHMGKKLSTATREKMRRFHTGRKRSMETRTKMSESAKKRFCNVEGCFT